MNKTTKNVQSAQKQSAQKQSARKWTTRIVLGLIALAIVAALVSAFLPKPVTVTAAKVTRGKLVVSIEEDGVTRVKDRYIVSAPLAGNLARSELKAGALVKAEAVIARVLPLPTPLLDPRSQAQGRARLAGSEAALRQAQAAEARARASLSHSQKELARVQPLAKNGGVPQQQVDELEYQVAARKEELASAQFASRVARHQVSVNQAALGRLTGAPSEEEMPLHSPIDGMVLEVFKQSEGAVQPGTPLVELGDPKALEVVVDVLTTDAVRIDKGDKAVVTRWGGSEELAAHVARIEPKAFTKISALGVEEQRVNVVLELDAPHEKWASLGDGYRVEAKITVTRIDAALQVPAGALFRHDSAWSVYRIEDETAQLQEVTVGAQSGLRAEIKGGLREGQMVIVHPGEKVNDGIGVSIRR